MPKDNVTLITGARESRDEQQNRINDELQELVGSWAAQGVDIGDVCHLMRVTVLGLELSELDYGD